MIAQAGYAQALDANKYYRIVSWDQWNQVYTITPGPTPGYYHIASTQSGGAQCWDVEGISSANGARIQQWGCGPLANQEWQFVEASPRMPLTRVQTFGYQFSGSGSAWINTQSHGNLGDVYTLSDLPNLAINTNLKARIVVDYLVRAPRFGSGIISYEPTYGGLKSDYQDLWAAARAEIQPYANKVGMFYLSDEPYWNFDMINSGFSHAEIYQMLSLVADMIKADFPNIPVTIVEGWPSLNPNPAFTTYPPSVDWVGFDCYDTCTDPNTYMTFHNWLKASLTSAQKIILSLWGYVGRAPNDSSDPSSGEITTLLQQQDFYTQLALTDDKAVGMLVFLGDTTEVRNDSGVLLGVDIGILDSRLQPVKAQWAFVLRALGLGTP